MGELPPFDPYAILAALERRRVAYNVIGGFARVVQGAEEITHGVDIVPSLRGENLRRLGLALDELGAERVDGGALVLDEATIREEPLIALRTPKGELRVVPEPAGTRGGYDDLRRAATREPIGKGLRPSIASTADLARMLAASTGKRTRRSSEPYAGSPNSSAASVLISASDTSRSPQSRNRIARGAHMHQSMLSLRSRSTRWRLVGVTIWPEARTSRSASASRLLWSLVAGVDGAASGSSSGSPAVGAVGGMDEGSVLVDGVGGGLDRCEAAGAVDGFGGREPLALFLEAGLLLLQPGAFPLLALGFLLGAVALDGGRGDAAGELVEDGRGGELLRLVDALPVGVGHAGGVGEPPGPDVTAQLASWRFRFFASRLRRSGENSSPPIETPDSRPS